MKCQFSEVFPAAQTQIIIFSLTSAAYNAIIWLQSVRIMFGQIKIKGDI